MLYRVLKPGVRQATSGGGFRRFAVGDRITISPEGARPLLERGFVEVVKVTTKPVEAEAAGAEVKDA